MVCLGQHDDGVASTPRPEGRQLRVLTIRQPWASAIFADHPGRKNVDNRTWYTKYRGRLYIHSAARPERTAPLWAWHTAGPHPPLGVILGHVNLVACTMDEGEISRWVLEGLWHWWMHEPVRLPDPYPCRGHQSLWPVPPGLLEAGS